MYITYDRIFLVSDWCAKIYEHDDFNGWEKVVGETSQLNLDGNEDDQLTSVRIRPGCTLDLFDNWNNFGLLGSLTSNVSLVNYNDKVSSLSCTCTDVVDKGDGTEDPEGVRECLGVGLAEDGRGSAGMSQGWRWDEQGTGEG